MKTHPCACHFRAISAALTLVMTSAGFSAEKPNILLVTSDDLGLQLGCYGDGIATTPHLDRFAGEGLKFTQGYVTQASCSPSRSSMLTGLYPHQNGQLGLSHMGYQMHDASIPNIPAVLKEAGYRTGILGKLHVAPQKAFPFDFSGVGYTDSRDPEKVAASFGKFLDGMKEDTPFFFMLNLTDPHDPFLRDVDGSPEKKVGAGEVEPFPFMNTSPPQKGKSFPYQYREDTPELRLKIADYYTCVNRVDECFGSVMEALERRGLENDTLVVFIGDHGPPFPRAKTTAFNAGNHIPFLVRWPGVVAGGGTRDQLVCTIDLMPTFLAAAGAPAPDGLPGLNLIPLMEDPASEWRTYLGTEFNSHQPGNFVPQRCIQDDRWRLIVNLLRAPGFPKRETYSGLEPHQAFGGAHNNMPPIGLYDLENDPWEKTNLARKPEHKQKLEELMAELQAWRERTADPFLDPQVLLARAEEEAMRVVKEKAAR